MELRLSIVYEAPLQESASKISEKIQAMFPALKIVVSHSLEIPLAAWDTFRGQYDIHYLLGLLEVSAGADLTLWMVQGDIGDPWHTYLYGAAGDRRAIVSTARLDRLEDIAKEACHEVGHLLGLTHCNNDCVMHTSRTDKQVTGKPGRLCEACEAFL